MAELISQLTLLIKGVWKHRWLAMTIAWVILIIGSIIIFQLPNNYQASARVYVDTQSILKPLFSGMTTVPNVEQQVFVMSRTLLSRPNLERVIRMTDLDIKADTLSDKEKLVDDLFSRIKITQTDRDDIYTITYNNEDPKLGKNVVQSLLTIFVEGSIGDKKQDSEKAVRFIGDQIKNYEQKLVDAENALKEFKQKNAELLPRQGGDYVNKLDEAAGALSQARLDLAEAEQARNAIQRQLTGDDNPNSKNDDMPVMASPELNASIEAANKQLDDLRTRYTEAHPDVIAARRLVAELEKRKRDDIKNHKPGINTGSNYSPVMQQLSLQLSEARAKAASMRARVEEYTARYARLKAQSIAAPDVEAQFTQLNRDYQVNKDNYEKLVARRDAARLSGDLSTATDLLTFRVIDPPTVPRIPDGPKRLRLLSLLFIAALASGAGVTIFLTQLRPYFVSQHQLAQITGLPVLGSVAMNWTPVEIARHTRNQKRFYATVAAFFSFYVIAMGILLWRGL